jgi:hypothetical protein
LFQNAVLAVSLVPPASPLALSGSFNDGSKFTGLVELGEATPDSTGRPITSGIITSFEVSVDPGSLKLERTDTTVPSSVKIPSTFTYSSKNLSGSYTVFDNSFVQGSSSQIILDLVIGSASGPLSLSQLEPDLSSQFNGAFRDLRLLYDLETKSLVSNPFGTAFSQEIAFLYRSPGSPQAIYSRVATDGAFTLVPEPYTLVSMALVLPFSCFKRSRKRS